jgi:hypothetical protein
LHGIPDYPQKRWGTLKRELYSKNRPLSTIDFSCDYFYRGRDRVYIKNRAIYSGIRENRPIM